MSGKRVFRPCYHHHMAVKVERRVVCDFGERHSGEIKHYRITVDGQSKTFDLCPTCAKPVQRLWDRGAGAKTPKRNRVYTMSEIQAKHKKTPPS